MIDIQIGSEINLRGLKGIVVSANPITKYITVKLHNGLTYCGNIYQLKPYILRSKQQDTEKQCKISIQK